jgi:uncharacterized protein (TIGR02301 family)
VRALAAGLALSLIACPALAQDRSPVARQNLIDLAYILGQSHALRQACNGERDQYWRNRMFQLLDVEGSFQAEQARLANTFSTGYLAERARFPSCSKASKAEAAQLAKRGQTLSEALAKP